jgi:hypothetical protein
MRLTALPPNRRQERCRRSIPAIFPAHAKSDGVEKGEKVSVVKTLSGMQTTESFTAALDEVLAR